MINPVAIQVGPFSIRWYAIFIVGGLLLAIYLAMKEAPRKKINPEKILDFILLAFPLAIVGARIYYVVFDWSYYSSHLGDIIAIWNGGIAIYGGLLTGLAVLLIFSYYQLINAIDFLDIAVPGVMIAQAIGRWGNFVNQEAYGVAVKSLSYLPSFIQKQMYIDGSYRIPTFLYESSWNFLGFMLIMSVRHRLKFLKRGDITFFYCFWYGSGRFVIEGMRTDSLMFMGLRVSQWLSAILVVIGLVGLVMIRRNKNIPYYLENKEN